MNGKIKWYNPKKGYGFIEVEGENDIFIHHSDVPQFMTLEDGDSVTFDTSETKRGFKAINIIKNS